MADIKIKIDLQSTTEDVINGFTANVGVNNVSKLTSETTTKNIGVAGLSFAKDYLKFSNGILSNYDDTSGVAQMERGYNGFMFGAVAEDKTYTCTITITGTNIDGIHIYGDKSAEQFPTEAYLDGDNTNLIYNDDYDWAIRFSTPQNSHSITFTKWNRPNYNACITHLAVLLNELWLDKSWIKDLESLSQSTASPNEISYGVLANSGSANIIDRNGEILDYIQDGIIENSNLPISVFANGKQIQAHIISNSDYLLDRTFSVEFTNKIDLLRNIKVDMFKRNAHMASGEDYSSLYDFISDIFDFFPDITPEKFEDMLSEKIFISNYKNTNSETMTIKDYFKRIKFPFQAYFRDFDNLYSLIDSICKATQTYFIQTDNGNFKFISARPRRFLDEKIIKIPISNQFSYLNPTVFIKNKYDNVEYENIIQSISIENVFQKTFNLKDSNGISTLESLGDLASVKTISGSNYLCFFVEVSHSSKAILSDVKYSKDGIRPFRSSLKTDVDERVAELIYILDTDPSYTRENYPFTASGIRRLPYYSKLNSDIFAIRIPLLEDISNYISLGIDIYMRVISESSSVSKFNANTKVLSFKTENEKNQFLNSGLEYKYYNVYDKMYDILFNNITRDYKNGVIKADLKVCCGDYYNTNDEKEIDFSKGEVLQVGQIIVVNGKDNSSIMKYPNGSDYLWRIVGRKFIYSGLPKLELELQEVVGTNEFSQIIFNINNIITNYDLYNFIDVYIDDVKTDIYSSTNQALYNFDKKMTTFRFEKKTYSQEGINYEISNPKVNSVNYVWGNEIISYGEDVVGQFSIYFDGNITSI